MNRLFLIAVFSWASVACGKHVVELFPGTSDAPRFRDIDGRRTLVLWVDPVLHASTTSTVVAFSAGPSETRVLLDLPSGETEIRMGDVSYTVRLDGLPAIYLLGLKRTSTELEVVMPLVSFPLSGERVEVEDAAVIGAEFESPKLMVLRQSEYISPGEARTDGLVLFGVGAEDGSRPVIRGPFTLRGASSRVFGVDFDSELRVRADDAAIAFSSVDGQLQIQGKGTSLAQVRAADIKLAGRDSVVINAKP